MTDRSDRRALIKQCQVPSYARIKEYNGFPAMNGFGQREGLKLSAKYNLPRNRVTEFENSLKEKGSQWAPLPIPPDVLKRIRFKFSSVDLNSSNGFFRCRTAGDNVLRMQDTSSCSNPKGWVMFQKDPPRWRREEVPLESIDFFSDIIISVYEANTKTISVGVASGY
jgi:hypothetical protein